MRLGRNARRVLHDTGESPARPSTPGPGLPTLSQQSVVTTTCARWALLCTRLSARTRGRSYLAQPSPRPRRQKLPCLWSTRVVRACSPRTLGRWLPRTPWSTRRRSPLSPSTPPHSPCPQSPRKSPLLCPSPSIRSPPSRRGVKKGELDVFIHLLSLWRA